MKKSTTCKCHYKFCFVVLASSFAWLLCHAYFTFLKDHSTFFIFLGHNFASTSSHNYMSYRGIHVIKESEYARDPLGNVKIIGYEKKHASGSTKYGEKYVNHEVESVGRRFTMKEHHFSSKVEEVGPKSVAKLKNDASDTVKDPCTGRYIYIHNLPSRFNEDMIKNCSSISQWTNMCNFTANLGLGPVLEDTSGWFATHQFMLEVIFHYKMRKYECLTNDSSMASAIYVPYYAGLDVSRYLWISNTSMRDAGSLDLVKWLKEKPEWRRMWGRDHFMVAGRTTWDFRRPQRDSNGWGNQLLMLPETKNMTVLVIEKSPWNNNDFAIPYPTYFHPMKVEQVLCWQRNMRNKRRSFLFCFAGAPRPGRQDSIRGNIFEQCRVAGNKCKMMECEVREESKCHQPAYVMEMFQNSNFCLQPPGDSYTRRSIFDSLLAGCIPVFFHPASAYVQYLWHLPKDYTRYSVFISAKDVQYGNVSIETVLNRIPKAKVRYMRHEVVKLIPRIIYTDPRIRSLSAVEDGFDVTIKRVLERVDKVKRDGVDSSLNVAEELTWKYSLSGTVDEHRWNSFFVKEAG